MKPPIGSSLLNGAKFLVASLAANLALFYIGVATNGFGPGIVATQPNEEIAAQAVAISTVFGFVMGTGLFLLLRAFMKSYGKAFTIVVAFFTALSFITPITGITGCNTMTVVLLELMHVVVGVGIWMAYKEPQTA